MTRWTPLIAALALVAAPAAPAAAQGAQFDDVINAELRPGWRTASGTHIAAVHVALAEGWMTYWRSPGIAGIAPRFDWAGSRNIAGAVPRWPRPEVFDQQGYRSIGYAGAMVLPLEITPETAGAPITAALALDIGVCREICIPVTLDLHAEMPAGGNPDSVIAEALAAQPETAAQAGVTAHDCRVTRADDALELTARVDMPALGGGEVAVFEHADAAISMTPGATRREGGQLTATSRARTLAGAPASFDRSGVRITVLGATRAVEIAGCPRGG